MRFPCRSVDILGVFVVSSRGTDKDSFVFASLTSQYITMQCGLLRFLRLMCGLLSHISLCYIWMSLNATHFLHYFPQESSLSLLIFSYVSFHESCSHKEYNILHKKHLFDLSVLADSDSKYELGGFCVCLDYQRSLNTHSRFLVL